MKRAAVVAAVVMIVGAGWWGAAAILGEQSQQGPSAAPPPAPAPSAPASSAPPAPPATAPEPPSAKNGPVAIPRQTEEPDKNGPVAIPRQTEEPTPAPAKPAPVAIPRKTAEPPKTDGLESIIPPPQMPDVDIPPIPEVKKEAPFKPGPRPVAKKKSDAIDEGKRLFDREGRLEVDPLGRPLFVFDSGDKPMQLLENTQRELLENATERGKRHAKWRISGIVTVYEGKNFLLITRATRILAEQEKL
ncbi:MAG: hypothetical protein NTY65_09880 [Planctomycetota bacterium]|nr:hypothetical protein [Planctomycetota bacterium]